MLCKSFLSFVLCVVCEQLLCDAIRMGPGVAEFNYTELGSHYVDSNDRTKCIGKVMRNGWCRIKEFYTVVKTDLGCSEGWIYDSKTDGCKPKCKKGCINGTCVAPEVCVCPESHVLVKRRCIKPTCKPACGLYRECTNMNTCTCTNNTVTLNDTTCAPICPDGYFNDPIECSPICDKCFNGTCTGPNQCDCEEGYANSDSFCVPVCHNCTNGDCIAPAQCMCHKNYTMQNGVCSPVCSKECVNGICAKPNKCLCNKGYNMRPDNPFVCLPNCSKECVNSRCVSPETCLCFIGFEQNVTNPNVCYKRCDGECQNGLCTLDGICQCKENYTLINGTCFSDTKDCADCTEDSCDSRCISDQNHYPAEITSAGLAGLQLSWLLSGAVALLLLVLLIVIIHKTWKRRMALEKKVQEEPTSPSNYSYMCSNPNQLLKTRPYENNDNLPDEETDLDYDTIPINDDIKSEYEMPLKDRSC